MVPFKYCEFYLNFYKGYSVFEGGESVEGVLGAGWHFRKGVQEGLPGEGREEPYGDEGGSPGRERTAKAQRHQGAGLGRLEQSARGGTQVQDRQGTDRGTLWASEGLGLWVGRWGGLKGPLGLSIRDAGG